MRKGLTTVNALQTAIAVLSRKTKMGKLHPQTMFGEVIPVKSQVSKGSPRYKTDVEFEKNNKKTFLSSNVQLDIGTTT